MKTKQSKRNFWNLFKKMIRKAAIISIAGLFLTTKEIAVLKKRSHGGSFFLKGIFYQNFN